MKRFVVVLLLLGVALGARSAAAHTIGLSRGHYTVLPNGIEARLVFDRDELVRALAERDPTTDGEAFDSSTTRARLEGRIVQSIRVRDRDGEPCPGVLFQLESTGQGGAVLGARYLCAGAPDTSTVELEFWNDLTPGHRHLASTVMAGADGEGEALAGEREGQEEAEQILHAERRRLEIAAAAPQGPSPLEWISLGIEHIVAGYDHLLFLLALVLVTPALRTLAATVSVFTLAHSITLALATLQVFALPPALVECAIALSITFVGLENLTERASRQRHFAVFAFGLIHGFGFAGALAELRLPQVQTPAALFSFNLGVELGQLGILALAYPIRRLSCRTRWFLPRAVPALSVCIAFAGLCWFIDRI
jgi:hydrogenase/urease accessory protein HupE